MKWGFSIFTVCVGVPNLFSSALGAPEAPLIASSWQLQFEFHDPQRIEVKLPGYERPTYFWYVLYTVTNATHTEVDFYPTFRLVTDNLEVVRAGDGVLPQVVEAIASRHRTQYPFLIPPTKVTGRLLQGQENAKSSVAVFRPFNVEASGFTLFVGGLSGDMERIANPAYNTGEKEPEENPSSFLFRRTLAVKYDLPGDPVTRRYTAPRRTSREWVMR